MLREAARSEFIAIITLDGLTEAAPHTHCLSPLCGWVCVCVCHMHMYVISLAECLSLAH